MPALNDLHRRYASRAAFYVVYIQEAHPVDFWQSSSNVRDRVLVQDAKTLAERDATAGTCLIRLGIRIPAVLDRADNQVERAYTGWPDRLYLIDESGRIAYKSAAGPFGFHADDLERALERTLAAGGR